MWSRVCRLVYSGYPKPKFNIVLVHEQVEDLNTSLLKAAYHIVIFEPSIAPQVTT